VKKHCEQNQKEHDAVDQKGYKEKKAGCRLEIIIARFCF
jgi:hypothetical protein